MKRSPAAVSLLLAACVCACTACTNSPPSFGDGGSPGTDGGSGDGGGVDGGGSTMARPAYNTGVGFFVGPDNRLYDANGHPFVIKGVNRVHYDDNAGPAIAKSGANAERWVLFWANGTTAAEFVAQITSEDHDHGIVAIPGIWTTAAAYGGTDTTCNSDTTALSNAVDEWVAQEADWKTIERWSIINIANEWGPSNSTVWRDSYITAVSRMRAAGYTGTLLVDAGGCGEDADDIINFGQAVFDADPQKNVMFSIHVYYNVQAGEAATYLDALNATGLPILVGEFGPGRNIGPAPTDLTPLELMAAADDLGMGWIGWAWDDNDLAGAMSDDNGFAMVYDNNGAFTSNTDLTTFGTDVVLDPTHGLRATAVPATVFP